MIFKRKLAVSKPKVQSTATVTMSKPVTQKSDKRQFTLVDNQKRSVLFEGRSSGFGFSFCSLDPDTDTLTTRQPFSPCKDYLSDFCYSEATKKPYQACGLSTTYTGAFEAGRAWLAFRICGSGCRSTFANPQPYTGMDKDLVAIEEGRDRAQELINEIERLLGTGQVKRPTKLYRVMENCVVARLDPWWYTWTYRISLLSLIIRNAFTYPGLAKQGAIEYLTECSKSGQDAYMLKAAVTHLTRMIAEGRSPKDDWSRKTGWHGAGICALQWPEGTDEIPLVPKPVVYAPVAAAPSPAAPKVMVAVAAKVG